MVSVKLLWQQTMSSLFGRVAPQPQQQQTDAQKKEAVMNSVRQEVAAANAKELVDNMTEKCYAKCVTKPGTSLTSSEETCVGRCMELYLQAFTAVTTTYRTRLGKERLAELHGESSSS